MIFLGAPHCFDFQFTLVVPAPAKQAMRNSRAFLVVGVLCLAFSLIIISLTFTSIGYSRNHFVKPETFTVDYGSPNKLLIDGAWTTLSKNFKIPNNQASRKLLIPPSIQGRGTLWYPDEPAWDPVGLSWNYKTSLKYYPTGTGLTVNFTGLSTTNLNGVPTLENGFPVDFYRLPCDVPMDETLITIGVCLLATSFVMLSLSGAYDAARLIISPHFILTHILTLPDAVPDRP